MDAQHISELVKSQIGDQWNLTNAHGVDLRQSLVPPQKIKVIERLVQNGKVSDRLIDVWLVLVEKRDNLDGYRIVAKLDGSMFGLASAGFPTDDHLGLCGWYGDFVTTLRSM